MPRITVLLALALGFAAVAGSSLQVSGTQPSPTPLGVEAAGQMGRYNPVTPSRVLDTRDGTGHSGKISGGQEITVDVTGVGGIPNSGVTAVVINVTITEPTEGGYLTVFPANASRPNASNLNFSPGETIPNLVIVKVSGAGSVKVFNSSGAVHVIFDVAGWFGNGAGSEFTSVTPSRILDTRDGTGGISSRIGAGQEISVDVTGVGGVPNSNVVAIVINVTVTEPTAGGYLTVFPSNASRPLASNLNFTPGQTIPNLVIVKVGADGKVKIYNPSGDVHVIFDVAGHFAGTSASGYQPLSPARILDTRDGTGGFSSDLDPGQEISLKVTSVGGVPSSGVTAVVINVTVTGPTAGGYLTLYPSNANRPHVSNLNFPSGETIPNLVIVKTGSDGRIKIYNSSGYVHVVIDVGGFFGPSGGSVPTPAPTSRPTPQPTPRPTPIPTLPPSSAVYHCWTAVVSYRIIYPDALSGFSDCAVGTGADYSCYVYSGSYVDCDTSASWPDYSCYVYSFGDADCSAASFSDPDYDCYAFESLGVVDCNTSDFDFPDYSCDVYSSFVSCTTFSAYSDFSCSKSGDYFYC